jgi:hypothetical protein
VLVLHEPAGLVSSDWKDSDIGRVKMPGDIEKDAAVAIGSVSSIVDETGRGLDHEPAPERHPPIP